MGKPDPTVPPEGSVEHHDPVGVAAVVEGVRQLSNETRGLRITLARDHALRRVRWIIATFIAAGLWVNVAAYRHADRRTARLAKENHAILVTVQGATDPAAQAKANQATAKAVGQIIVCIENHEDHLADPSVVLIGSCPQP